LILRRRESQQSGAGLGTGRYGNEGVKYRITEVAGWVIVTPSPMRNRCSMNGAISARSVFFQSNEDNNSDCSVSRQTTNQA